MDVQESVLEKEATSWAVANGKNVEDAVSSFQSAADFIFNYIVERTQEDTPAVVMLAMLRRVCNGD